MYYRVVFLPHDATPGNRQYTSRESVANGKQAVAHSLNTYGGQSSTRPRAKPKRSSRSTESLESISPCNLDASQAARLSHREVGFKRSTRLEESPADVQISGLFLCLSKKIS